MLKTGTQLGPYEILTSLGAGGMGEVYRAKDTRLDRMVAIKVLSERTARDEAALGRFRRETKALAALSHPNVLMILDVGELQGFSFAVMELLEGETLRQRMGTHGVDWRKSLELCAAIADGIGAAHTRGIVHRDLKPENLFLTRDGVVKILDFGLARNVETIAGAPGSATVPMVTQPGVLLGTVNYMSPEQVRGQQADARSDIFALGCVLYELVTGKPPFAQETAAETMTAILRNHPPLPSTFVSHIPPAIDHAVAKCLEKSPDARVQSAQDLAGMLRSILGDSGAISAAKRGGVPGPALAVLPFRNMSSDSAQEYFVDGMTEALISGLAKIKGLKVISRTSVMRYKATPKSLPEIARELNVSSIVEGSVMQVGNRIRINAQLISAATDEHLWAESYDRDLSDVLLLHSELARTIAQEIKVTLTPQEQARIFDVRSVNPAAHEAYLKGRFHWNKRTPDALQKAVEYFDRAITVAPEWPLGYAGLADAHLLMAFYSPVSASEAISKARAAAAKALEMDESLAEPHATLAHIATLYDWDWRSAERNYERAIALSPNYATAQQWYGIHHLLTGRFDESIRVLTKAQVLDPLSVVLGANLGQAYYHAGDFERAETAHRKLLELGSEVAVVHRLMVNPLLLQGKIEEAVTEAREAARISRNASFDTAQLGYVCAKAGQSEEARAILDELSQRAAKSYVSPTYFALIHAGLGELDKMFDRLESAYREHDVHLIYMLRDPILAPMNSDQRFTDLMRRVGLTQSSSGSNVGR